MTKHLQPTPFMNILNTEQIMDAQSVIDQLKRDVKDKTLLVRFYNLKNGTDIWIDGLCWRLYDFDMKMYLSEEFGINIDEMLNQFREEPFTFDVMDADDDFIKRHCFNKNGVFSQTTYDHLNAALVDMSDEAIDAGVASGISIDNLNSDVYRGKWPTFAAFAEDLFNELSLHEVPEAYRKFIDYEKVAESYEQDFYYNEGHVFDATYR